MNPGDHRIYRCAVLLGLLLPSALPAAEQDPCAAFAWNVSHERALFAATAQAVQAGSTAANAPQLSTERLYELQLSAQTQVSLAVAPHKPAAADSHAGLAHLTLTEPGLWRISLDSPAWVEVLANGAVISSRDFQGRPGCSAPHKIVEFELPAGIALTLQLSGAAAPAVRLAVTRAPTP